MLPVRRGKVAAPPQEAARSVESRSARMSAAVARTAAGLPPPYPLSLCAPAIGNAPAFLPPAPTLAAPAGATAAAVLLL